METSNSHGLIRWVYVIVAIGMMIVPPATVAGTKVGNEQSISRDYNVCVRGLGQLAVSRYDIIDVEKVMVGWRKEKPFAEIVFSEMGVGAYSKMLQDTASNGVLLSSGSGVVVYGQLFQPDGLFFIGKSLQKDRAPVWIYAKFFGSVTPALQASAMKVMIALRSCSA